MDFVVSNDAVVLVKSLSELELALIEQGESKVTEVRSDLMTDLIQAVKEMQSTVKALDADLQVDLDLG